MEMGGQADGLGSQAKPSEHPQIKRHAFLPGAAHPKEFIWVTNGCRLEARLSTTKVKDLKRVFVRLLGQSLLCFFVI